MSPDRGCPILDRCSCGLFACLIAGATALPVHADHVPDNAPRTVNTWTPYGPTLSTIFVITRDPLENGELLAGTNFGGMYRSTDGGLNWAVVDSPFNTDAVFGIAVAPTTPRTILVATQNGGMYRSTDAGATWNTANIGLPAGAVRTVAIDPINPAHAIAAADGAVYTSLDGGLTWSPTVSTSPEFIVEHLLFDPTHAGVVYAGTRGQGMHRSTDAGATWLPYSDGIGPEADIVAISLDENDPDRVWAASTAGVFSRRPGDAQWVNRTHDLPEDLRIVHVATVKNRPEVVICTTGGVYTLDPSCAGDCAWTELYDVNARKLIADRTGFLVHVVHAINFLEATDDFGEGWFPAARGMQNLFCGALLTVDVDGVTGIYAGTGNDIRATADGFVEQGEQQWGLQLDVGGAVFDLAADPTNPQRMFAGAEGFGVFRSTNFGVDWTNTSDGMRPQEITDIEQARTPEGTVYAGTSAGPYISADGGRNWQQRAQDQNPAPVVDVEADPVFPGWVYYATADGRLYRSQNDGAQFFQIWQAPPGDTIRQLDRAPFFELYAVMASGSLLASTDDGISFFPRGQQDIAHDALCIAVNETRPWIAYVGTRFGGVYRTDSNGAEWEQRSVGMPNASISGIALAPDDDTYLVAGSTGGVYISTDQGASWIRRTAGLPTSGLVSAVQFDPAAPNRVFARITIPEVEPSAVPQSKPVARKTLGAQTRPRPGNALYQWYQEGLEQLDIPTSTAEGLYVSHDRGHTWYPLTKDPDLGNARTLCISRTEPGTVIVGVDRAGIARSTNLGITWESASDGLTLIVLSIAIDPTTPQTMYAGTFSSGVFKSTDGGDTWTSVGPEGVIVFHVAVDPIVPTTVYASTSLGVMRSDNAGASWRLAGQDTPYIISLAHDPTNPDRVYACSFEGKMYRSDDAGATWLDISEGLPADDINGAAVSAATGTVYALTAEQGVYRSHDGGAHWWPANTAPFAGLRAVNIAIDPAHDDIYVGLWGGGLRSSDGGNTWTSLPLDFGEDYPSAISTASIPNGPSIVFISVLNEQGQGIDPGRPVLRSNDRGATWTVLGETIPSNDATAVAVAPGLAARVYLASGIGVYLSDDLGATWNYASGGLDDTPVTSLAVDPTDPQRVLAATPDGLFQTVNGGAIWTPLDFDHADLGAVPLAVRFAGAGRIFVGTTERGVFFSTNNGVSWRGGVTPETSVMVPHALAVDPLDRDTLWVATGDQGVAASRDRGETWSLENTGLGADVMFTITIDPVEPSTIYATSQDAGVWVSTDAGASWSPLNDGLFHRFVTAFAIDANNHKIIYAGTEGGGVFRLVRP